MAAKAGQILQAELLVVYGADPGAPDINGRTPMDYARYKTVREYVIKQFATNLSILNPLTFQSDIIVDAAHAANSMNTACRLAPCSKQVPE